MIDDDFNIDFGNIELPDLDLDLFAGPGDDEIGRASCRERV